MNGESLTPHNVIITQLKQQLPEVFTEGKIDWEKLKVTLGENINFSNERYVLNWAGKSDAFRVMQEPSYQTLIPVEEDSVDFYGTENIFIEGENLEVLKVLQKSYFGKVKMIYIDPPYNTGNDSFIYPDRFSETKEEYQKRVGDKDDEGYMTSEGMFRRNSRENGQYHSNWLNMMMPRLYLAKNLLQEDGVIFISIDDNEVHNLRLLMNEIFGEENFVGELIWKSRQNKDNRNITGLSIDHEYVLCYSKYNDGRKLNGSERKTEQYANPDNDSRGDWVSGNMVGLLGEDLRPNCHYDLINPETGINYGKPKLGWRYDKKTMSRLIEEKRIIWPDSKDGRPRRKVFLNELNSELPNFTSIIGEKTYTRDGTKEIDELFNSKYFDFPKPTTLIGELIKQGTDCRGNDIILDFFAGSATTAHAVMQLNKDGGNRKYICVQMPEPCEEKSEAYKAGYNTIADIAKERIRRAGKKIQSEIAEENRKNKEKLDFDKSNEEIKLDTGFKVFKLSVSNFKQWRQSPLHNSEELTDQLKLFIDPIAENAIIEDMVYELLLKSGKDLNSRVENNDGYYLIDSNELAFILEKVNEQIILEVLSEYPKKVIALDRIFNENDQLKTNTALQMKDAGVEFKTI
ncbi:site-specific DNA-methyltransferase [Proteiniphilum acetatigenes]|jgi:adenine-specific DNA-methyltransferase|uniref:site-specific DNA-methyltransferase n=2 Tax=Proteiniphilum TaxID=294702 RepID=UPI00037D36D4|nr:site-specific DNA-methyltransferase [Proteiniphilum acetatigenes]